MEVNKRILSYIKEKGIVQSDFAKKLGYTQANLSRILNSDDIKLSQLEKICVALDVPVTYFFQDPNQISDAEKKVVELESTLKQFKFHKIDKFLTEAFNILKYGYPDVKESVKEKVKAEIVGGIDSYKTLVHDLLGNFMLDLSEVSKQQIKQEIDELIKKHSQE